MAKKVSTWVWVVVAIVCLGILGIVAIAGVSLYYFSQHIETRQATASGAEEDFDAVRARFAGQKPLIELDEHGELLRSNPDRPEAPNARTPEALYVMAFDPDDGRIVQLKVPFWLLRLKMGNSSIDFNGNRMELEDLHLTVEDLERFGPTLIVDYNPPDGDRVLVWSQ